MHLDDLNRGLCMPGKINAYEFAHMVNANDVKKEQIPVVMVTIALLRVIAQAWIFLLKTSLVEGDSERGQGRRGKVQCTSKSLIVNECK